MCVHRFFGPMGAPWAGPLSDSRPGPAPGPWDPPAPPQVNLLTQSLRELTRSLRGGLCSVPKGREAIATGGPRFRISNERVLK